MDTPARTVVIVPHGAACRGCDGRKDRPNETTKPALKPAPGGTRITTIRHQRIWLGGPGFRVQPCHEDDWETMNWETGRIPGGPLLGPLSKNLSKIPRDRLGSIAAAEKSCSYETQEVSSAPTVMSSGGAWSTCWPACPGDKIGRLGGQAILFQPPNPVAVAFSMRFLRPF